MAIWLKAAAYLHDTDTSAIVELMDELIRVGQPWFSVELGELATRLGYDAPTLQFGLGYALQSTGRHAEATVAYRRALAVDPEYPQLRNNLASAIRMSHGDLQEAFALLEEAVAANPEEVNAWINLVNARRERHDLEGAHAAGVRALELAPGNAAAANNHSLTLKDAQRWSEADQYAKTACSLDPDNATYRFNQGILHLMQGRYAEGWPGFEDRWLGAMELRGARPIFPVPRWRGESLKGKTLFVWGEQGFGDVLQFCRFIPMLAERVHAQGGRIIWNSFPQVGNLLVRSLGRHVDGYTVGGGIESLPACDYEFPLMSLPFALKLDEATIQSTGPWLVSDPTLHAAWKTQLAAEPRLKVGLAWTGSLTHRRNACRRVGWERYAAHFHDLQDVVFYSLQPGAAADVSAARDAGLDLVDLTASFATFDHTAAFIDSLDLVITVCTSVAHLSGAIGQRTWVLLDANPHWPWQLERTDSPWYPTATLYRQHEFAHWEPVLETVTQDLRSLAAAHKIRTQRVLP
ncbi:tetratricopeptide repeat protein [Paraburkholderia dinghuensis]|nr:tetratricopeptide repeat protein [Paraburkholderia dinghuensis]